MIKGNNTWFVFGVLLKNDEKKEKYKKNKKLLNYILTKFPRMVRMPHVAVESRFQHSGHQRKCGNAL